MKRFLAPILTLVFLCPTAAAQKQAGTPSGPSPGLKAYLAELDHWSEAARFLKVHPEKAADMRKTLPPNWQVTIRGEHFLVPTDWLGLTLDSLEVNHWLAEKYSEEIQAKIARIRASAEALDQVSGTGPGIARTRLDEILRRREFREVRGPGWLDQLRERIANRIAEWLLKIFGGLTSRPNIGRLLLWIVVGFLSLVLLIWLIRSIRGLGGETKLDLKGSVPDSRTWKSWAQDALAAAGRGDYRGAIHFGYWASIYRLGELGALEIHRARTPREYLKGVHDRDVHQPVLADVTRRFELTWYGGSQASAEDFESVVTQLERLGCRLRSQPATASS